MSMATRCKCGRWTTAGLNCIACSRDQFVFSDECEEDSEDIFYVYDRVELKEVRNSSRAISWLSCGRNLRLVSVAI